MLTVVTVVLSVLEPVEVVVVSCLVSVVEPSLLVTVEVVASVCLALGHGAALIGGTKKHLSFPPGTVPQHPKYARYGVPCVLEFADFITGQTSKTPKPLWL